MKFCWLGGGHVCFPILLNDCKWNKWPDEPGHSPQKTSCTDIRVSCSPSFWRWGKPLGHHREHGTLPSKRSGAETELPLILQWAWGWIDAGSLRPIKVAMVTPGLWYLDFWCAGCRGNSCSASPIICQGSGREAQGRNARWDPRVWRDHRWVGHTPYHWKSKTLP